MLATRPIHIPRLQRLPQSRISPLKTLSPYSPRFNSASTRPRRFRLSYIWYAVCLCFGVGTGYIATSFIAPPPYPKPGSQEDELALHALASDVDSLDVVKTLRAEGFHLHADTPLNEIGKGHRGWMELDVKRNITEAASDNGQSTRTLTRQSMAGVQGLGVQRVFWNSETRELVAVVWMGGALTGWPGLAHGGAIATIFEEAMLRLVAGPNVSVDSIPPPSSMSLTYARPSLSLNHYVLRASFSTPDLPQEAPPPEPLPAKSWLPSWKDFTKKPVQEAHKPAVEVSATLETLEGKVCVRAKGTFSGS
ncbi:hypothetical protein BCR34DRAFT_472765 [Clohesyomyces aquaticus]|uniref:Thioesterase domain-containing protein n=1 Tax=Clohesyomyces aquaticus TaxID=1231657 RepID=A0A1Y2A8K0_9PLEO|nr:hypothetical protein BCR34DRAFT_472765 [Clohesyomyces aquaticus]